MKPITALPAEMKEAMRLHLVGHSVVKACEKLGFPRSEYNLLKDTELFKVYWKELKEAREKNRTENKKGVSTDDIDEMAVQIIHCALSGKKYKGKEVDLSMFKMAMEWIKNSHRVETSSDIETLSSGSVDNFLKVAKQKGMDFEAMSEEKMLGLKEQYNK